MVERRIQERAHLERGARALERDERARVQHLCAEVGRLRRLAPVQVGDDARLGDVARVGGEDARHVLPQDDLDRGQRAGEERRGQVGAAAAERGHRAVGRGAEEPGQLKGRVAAK